MADLCKALKAGGRFMQSIVNTKVDKSTARINGPTCDTHVAIKCDKISDFNISLWLNMIKCNLYFGN